MIQFLFVINKGSGTNKADEWKETIDQFFEDRTEKYDIYFLPTNFTIKQIKDHIFSINPQTVVAVGGDGTVTMLANIIVGSHILLGILPGGSANGMAKELGISEKPTEALPIIVEGNAKPCDLIHINNKNYCLHLSDIGLNAHLIKHFDEGKLRGKLGYALVILKTLWHKEKMQVTIKTGDLQVKKIAFMVALANARMYGTGAVINPDGKLNDGLFEVIIVKKLSIGALLKMLFKPGIFDPKKIEIISCDAVDITTKRKIHFQIDGEYMGKIKNLQASISHNAISIILPA